MCTPCTYTLLAQVQLTRLLHAELLKNNHIVLHGELK